MSQTGFPHSDDPAATAGCAHPKLLTRPELMRRRAIWRRQGRRTVFTNGCYDLLHRGHVESLQAAADLGDLLVVGLNSDDSVHRLKGPGRPLQPLADRVILLGALSCVSWITVFDEISVASLVAELLPDVLVKGGDYTATEIVGADAVTAAGGRVVLTGCVRNASTTRLLARLRALPGD